MDRQLTNHERDVLSSLISSSARWYYQPTSGTEQNTVRYVDGRRPDSQIERWHTTAYRNDSELCKTFRESLRKYNVFTDKENPTVKQDVELSDADVDELLSFI